MSPTVSAASTALRLLTAGALVLFAAIGAPRAAFAQAPEPPPPGTQPTQAEGEARAPAYLASIDGVVLLEREGQSETAERGTPLVPGDRVRTEAGRAAVVFPNGSEVFVDRYSEIALQDVLALRVVSGRLFVRLQATIDAAERLAVDAPGASIEFQDDGEYRIAVGGADAVEVELAVLRGQAGLVSEGGNVLVTQGRRSVARDGEAPTTPEWFNAGQTALERWAADRQLLAQSGQYASRQYLPNELAGYAATFDRYGSWQNDETYGAVWYPSGTTEDWRPYYDGRWDYTSRYGWTWIAGGDVWAYPTHHYGRWHVGSRGWFWIPSRHWGSAWVYWAVAPGYVGWCPLGWNGRPVLNVFHYDRSYPSRWRDPYRAWTVVARDSFGRSRPTYADRGRLDRERPAFVLQHRAPGFAPPRSPYPSPWANTRIGGQTYGPDRTPASSGGVSTMSPRSYGRYGSTEDSRGGYAVPRGSASERDQNESPYERAQPYMPRPGRSDDDNATYRRMPADRAPYRSPRDRDGDGDVDRDDRDRDRGRSGPGYAGPGYRAPSSPGMSRPPERDRSPGMSDDRPGSRGQGSGRDVGPRDNGGSRAVPRDPGGRPSSGSPRGADGGSPRGGDGGGSRGGGGGATRRHP